MKRLLIAIAISIALPAGGLCAGAEDNWTALIERSGNALDEIRKMPDRKIPEEFLTKCEVVCVFPRTISGGLAIGGKYGKGIMMVRDRVGAGWSGPAIFTTGGISVGWQIGGEATDFILCFVSKESVDAILQGKFKLGVEADIAAGPFGRSIEVSTDIRFKGAMLSYSRSRGLFFGIKLGGAVISEDNKGNKELYSRELSAKEILFENKAPAVKAADKILSVLAEYPFRREEAL